MIDNHIKVKCKGYNWPIYFLQKEIFPLSYIGAFLCLVMIISLLLEVYLFLIIALILIFSITYKASLSLAIKRAKYITEVGYYLLDSNYVYFLSYDGTVINKLDFLHKSIELTGNDILIGLSVKDQIGTFGDKTKMHSLEMCNLENVESIYNYIRSKQKPKGHPLGDPCQEDKVVSPNFSN